jgi:glutaredoxin
MYQEEIVIYARSRSRSCRRARRLLESKGYAFEEVDVAGDDGLRVSLVETTGRKTLPLVFLGAWLAASEKSRRWSTRATWIVWYRAEFKRSKFM